MHDIKLFEKGRRILLLLTGENGSGKSTILEQVIIPLLHKNNCIFKYMSQNIELQRLVNRSLEAIVSVASSNRRIRFAKKLGAFSDQYNVPAILLMDETDKMLTNEELQEIAENEDIKLVLLVTHSPARLEKIDFLKNFDEVRLIMIEHETSQRRVYEKDA